MSTYTHLTQEERYHIQTQQKQKISLSDIAKGMGRHKATMSRELKRNTGQRGLNENHNGLLRQYFPKKNAV